jgi:hypothetical protein
LHKLQPAFRVYETKSVDKLIFIKELHSPEVSCDEEEKTLRVEVVQLRRTAQFKPLNELFLTLDELYDQTRKGSKKMTRIREPLQNSIDEEEVNIPDKMKKYQVLKQN